MHLSFLQPSAGTGAVLEATSGGTGAHWVGQAPLPASSSGIPAARFRGRPPPPNWEHGAEMPRQLAGKDACPTRLARTPGRVQETEMRPAAKGASRSGCRIRFRLPPGRPQSTKPPRVRPSPGAARWRTARCYPFLPARPGRRRCGRGRPHSGAAARRSLLLVLSHAGVPTGEHRLAGVDLQLRDARKAECQPSTYAARIAPRLPPRRPLTTGRPIPRPRAVVPAAASAGPTRGTPS